MTHRFLLAIALAASTATFARPARADEPQAQATARALFDEGVALTKEGRWLEACPKLAASLEAFPGVGTRGKLAECYEKTGRVASAWALWKEVALLSTKAGDPTREQIARERAAALEPRLAYLTVVVPPSISGVSGLVVKKNGQEIDLAKLGGADPTDPGPYTIEVSAPGKKTSSATVMVTQAAKVVYEVPALESTAKAPPSSATSAPAVAPAESARPTWQRPTGLAVAGVGVVALGAGAFLGLSAKSTYDDAFDRGACDRATKLCSAAGQGDIDDARSKATISTIAFVAGGALVAGGLVLFFTAPGAERAAIRVTPTTGGAAIGVTGAL